MILIDTSAWLFALKRNFHPAVKERIDALLKENDVAIIGIIQLELLGGAKSEEEYTRLKTVLSHCILSNPLNQLGIPHRDWLSI